MCFFLKPGMDKLCVRGALSPHMSRIECKYCLISILYLVGLFDIFILLIILWLTPRAGKMNQILCCDWLPEQKFLGKPYTCNKSFIDQVCSVKMAGYCPRSFLRVYGPRFHLGPQTCKKRAWPIFSHLDLALGQ